LVAELIFKVLIEEWKIKKTIHLQQVQEQIRQNLEASQMTELIRDFLDPGDFYRAVCNIGITFFCGVPDSLLKGNILYIKVNCTLFKTQLMHYALKYTLKHNHSLKH